MARPQVLRPIERVLCCPDRGPHIIRLAIGAGFAALGAAMGGALYGAAGLVLGYLVGPAADALGMTSPPPDIDETPRT